MREVSRKVNENAYQNHFLDFAILFLECLDVYGYDKKGFERLPIHFASKFPAEFIPDFANEMVSQHYDNRQQHFRMDRVMAIDLCRNMCHWLFVNSFTISKLNMSAA